MPDGPRQMPVWRDRMVLGIFNQVDDTLGSMHDIFQRVVLDAHTYKPEHVTMYFGTPDFTDLVTEMMRSFKPDDTQQVLHDIVRERGARGAVVIGFDSHKLPTFMLPGNRAKPEDWYSDVPKVEFNKATKSECLWLSWYEIGDGTVEACVSVHMAEPQLAVKDFPVPSAGYSMTTTQNSPLGQAAAVALWCLLNATLTQVESVGALQGLPPKVKKQMDPKHKNRESMVHVVNLRRRVSKNLGEVKGARVVDWQHSWIVDGFWRNQACGPGMRDHKLIYVTPFLKGPTDKPLLVHKEKVFKW